MIKIEAILAPFGGEVDANVPLSCADAVGGHLKQRGLTCSCTKRMEAEEAL